MITVLIVLLAILYLFGMFIGLMMTAFSAGESVPWWEIVFFPVLFILSLFKRLVSPKKPSRKKLWKNNRTLLFTGMSLYHDKPHHL